MLYFKSTIWYQLGIWIPKTLCLWKIFMTGGQYLNNFAQNSSLSFMPISSLDAVILIFWAGVTYTFFLSNWRPFWGQIIPFYVDQGKVSTLRSLNDITLTQAASVWLLLKKNKWPFSQICPHYHSRDLPLLPPAGEHYIYHFSQKLMLMPWIKF